MSEHATIATEYLQHHLLEHGIHEFVLLDFSHAGADAFVAALAAVDATLEPGTAAPLLVDASRGMYSVNYLFARLRDQASRSPRQTEASRAAVLMQPGILTTVISGMSRIFPRINVRIFRAEDRERALAWLSSSR